MQSSEGCVPARLGTASQWDTFQRSAFRLETLPEYRVAKEVGLLERYLAGEPMPVGYNEGWHLRLRDYFANGRYVQRVRVLMPPLTDYIRKQFDWGYVGNVSHGGEDIRILDLLRTPDLGLPDWDFWFFDDEIVLKQVYAEDGIQLGREVLADTDPAEFRHYRDIALRHAIPFFTYRAITGY
ncbi:MAG: DUF6879 family protein [Pseudonocardiaceae bacterium]